VRELIEQAALADPRLAAQEDADGPAGVGFGQGIGESGELGSPTDEQRARHPRGHRG
jgi:hypothetical protein